MGVFRKLNFLWASTDEIYRSLSVPFAFFYFKNIRTSLSIEDRVWRELRFTLQKYIKKVRLQCSSKERPKKNQNGEFQVLTKFQLTGNLDWRFCDFVGLSSLYSSLVCSIKYDIRFHFFSLSKGKKTTSSWSIFFEKVSVISIFFLIFLFFFTKTLSTFYDLLHIREGYPAQQSLFVFKWKTLYHKFEQNLLCYYDY